MKLRISGKLRAIERQDHTLVVLRAMWWIVSAGIRKHWTSTEKRQSPLHDQPVANEWEYGWQPMWLLQCQAIKPGGDSRQETLLVSGESSCCYSNKVKDMLVILNGKKKNTVLPWRTIFLIRTFEDIQGLKRYFDRTKGGESFVWVLELLSLTSLQACAR